MSNPDQLPPTVQAQQPDIPLDHGYGLMERFQNPVLARLVTGLIAFGGGISAAPSFSAESASGGETLALVGTHDPLRTSLRPQAILNSIHNVLHSDSGDHTQDNNCHIGGYNPFPKVPCRHDRIVPTSAFLEPSSGGFTTACADPYVSTYRKYEISPEGQTFQTCGPLGVFPKKSTLGEFQQPLNQLGSTIQRSVGLDYPESTISVVGKNRKKVTADYQCPAPGTGEDPAANANPEGVKTISIGRNHQASVAMC